MSDTAIIVTVLTTYLAALFGIALWSRGEAGTIEGYYLAGRRLPFWVAGFSANATGESGWLLLGLTGMGYLVGVQALWIALGEAIGIGLAWLVVARRLKAATDRLGSVTVPDFLADHFRDHSRLLRGLSVAIILSMVATYTAAQMIATGKAFSTFLPMDYAAGVLIGGGITLIYTAYGGFKAVAYSDLLQGALMLGGLIALPIAGWLAVQGGFWSQVVAIDPVLVSPSGGLGWSVPALVAVLSFAAIGLPFLGVPQLLVRYMAIRNPAEIPRAALVSVLCIVGFDVGAVLTGIAGRVLFPGLTDAETILPTMATELFSPWVTGLFLVIVLAAIMSTVDSLLILASSAVVRDVMQKIVGVGWGERRIALAGQLVTVAIGIGAIAFALSQAKVIFWFVLFAWSGLGAAFAPPVLCALFWRGTTAKGAVAGMIGGFATDMVWAAWLKPYFYDLYEIIPALIVGFALTIAVSRRGHSRLEGTFSIS